LIISKISGGVGNQMFQYAIAKAIAKKRNDKFKLDISFYINQKLRNYELYKFNIEENLAHNNDKIKLKGRDDFFFKLIRKLTPKQFRPKSYFLEKKNSVFYEEVFNYKNNIYLDGYWQNEKYFKDIKHELVKDFNLKRNLKMPILKLLNDIVNNESVSIHVRRGDYINNSIVNKIHGVCSIDYYKNASELISQNIRNPIFYIFSDDINWCKKNFNFIKSKFFIDNTSDALEDLELMKNCKHNITANSSFSWWAAWLNKNSSNIVISPKIWWKEAPEMNIACPGWVLL
jgi:hypothetical protein